MNKILLSNGKLFDKLETHKNGLKHYAFSVFLFNEDNELLLQKRAKCKYHSGGLWSNTCCSHFLNKDELNNRNEVAKKRLFDEIGLNFNKKLSEICVFEYAQQVGENLLENEIDYIFLGRISNSCCFNLNKSLNKNEVSDVKFSDLNFLEKDVITEPDKYTEWFKIFLKDKNFMSKMTFELNKI